MQEEVFLQEEWHYHGYNNSAQRNYTEEDRFQFRETTNKSLWTDYYASAVDYKSIIDLNTNPTTRTANEMYGNPDNQIASCESNVSLHFFTIS